MMLIMPTNSGEEDKVWALWMVMGDGMGTALRVGRFKLSIGLSMSVHRFWFMEFFMNTLTTHLSSFLNPVSVMLLLPLFYIFVPV